MLIGQYLAVASCTNPFVPTPGQTMQHGQGILRNGAIARKGAIVQAVAGTAVMRQPQVQSSSCTGEACGGFSLTLQHWRLRIAHGPLSHWHWVEEPLRKTSSLAVTTLSAPIHPKCICSRVTLSRQCMYWPLPTRLPLWWTGNICACQVRGPRFNSACRHRQPLFQWRPTWDHQRAVVCRIVIARGQHRCSIVVIYESKEVEKGSLMTVTIAYPQGRVEETVRVLTVWTFDVFLYSTLWHIPT